MTTTATLTPLKTVLELRNETSLIEFYVVKVPAILGNTSLDRLRGFNDSSGIDIHHLRRFARAIDLQSELRFVTHLDSANKAIRPNSTAPSDLYLLIGPTHSVSLSELKVSLLAIPQATRSEDLTILSIKVPRLAPTSYEQAQMWSRCYWPTVHNKNNLFGPQLSIKSRAQTEIRRDLHIWVEMAIRVAALSKSSGYGEAIGAIVVKRGDQGSEAVALAGDCRWNRRQDNTAGDITAHAVLRVIDMVARKLHAAQQKGLDVHPFVTTPKSNNSIITPVHPEERVLLETDNLSPDGYLCHGLEVFITHEPCVMCSMALLHSRFSKVVIGRRMPQTGGLCSEIRLCSNSPGYGLFWRKELNWSFLAWQLGVEELASVPVVSSRIHV